MRARYRIFPHILPSESGQCHLFYGISRGTPECNKRILKGISSNRAIVAEMVRFFNYIHMPPAELTRAVSCLLSLDRQFWHAMFSAA